MPMIPVSGRRHIWLLVLLCLSASGCGSESPIVPVSGIVKLDGEPMPDAVVEFIPDPDRGTQGPRSSATTDEKGRFILVCDDRRRGAVPGFHRVLIQDARTFAAPRVREGTVKVLPPSRVPERY